MVGWIIPWRRYGWNVWIKRKLGKVKWQDFSHVASLNCLITCIDLKSSTQEKILKDFLCCNINSAMIFFLKRKKNRGKVEKLINHYHKHICFALRTSKLVLLLLYKETQKFSFRRDHVKHYHVEKYEFLSPHPNAEIWNRLQCRETTD